MHAEKALVIQIGLLITVMIMISTNSKHWLECVPVHGKRDKQWNGCILLLRIAFIIPLPNTVLVPLGS